MHIVHRWYSQVERLFHGHPLPFMLVSGVSAARLGLQASFVTSFGGRFQAD